MSVVVQPRVARMSTAHLRMRVALLKRFESMIPLSIIRRAMAVLRSDSFHDDEHRAELVSPHSTGRVDGHLRGVDVQR